MLPGAGWRAVPATRRTGRARKSGWRGARPGWNEEREFEDDDCWFPGDADAVIVEARTGCRRKAAAAAHIAEPGPDRGHGGDHLPTCRRGPGQPEGRRGLPGVGGGGFATGQALDIAPGRRCSVTSSSKPGMTTGSPGPAMTSWRASSRPRTAARLPHIVISMPRSRSSSAAPGRGLPAPRRPGHARGRTNSPNGTGLRAGRIRRDGRAAQDAHDLEVKLPGTKARPRAGLISPYKAKIMTEGCDPLDPDEARAASRWCSARRSLTGQLAGGDPPRGHGGQRGQGEETPEAARRRRGCRGLSSPATPRSRPASSRSRPVRRWTSG